MLVCRDSAGRRRPPSRRFIGGTDTNHSYKPPPFNGSVHLLNNPLASVAHLDLQMDVELTVLCNGRQ